MGMPLSKALNIKNGIGKSTNLQSYLWGDNRAMNTPVTTPTNRNTPTAQKALGKRTPFSSVNTGKTSNLGATAFGGNAGLTALGNDPSYDDFNTQWSNFVNGGQAGSSWVQALNGNDETSRGFLERYKNANTAKVRNTKEAELYNQDRQFVAAAKAKAKQAYLDAAMRKLSAIDPKVNAEITNLMKQYQDAGIEGYDAVLQNLRTPEQVAQAKAMLSDYVQRKQATDKMNADMQANMDTYTQNMNDWQQGLEDSANEYQDSMTKWADELEQRKLKGVDEYRANVDKIKEEMLAEAHNNWNTAKGELKDYTAETLQGITQSIDEQYADQERELIAAQKAGDPEAGMKLEQLKIAKNSAKAGVLGQARNSHNQILSQLNSTMAGLADNLAGMGGQFKSYTEQNIFNKLNDTVYPQLELQARMDAQRYKLGIDQLKERGYGNLANFLSNQSYHLTDMGGLVSALVELDEQARNDRQYKLDKLRQSFEQNNGTVTALAGGTGGGASKPTRKPYSMNTRSGTVNNSNVHGVSYRGGSSPRDVTQTQRTTSALYPTRS